MKALIIVNSNDFARLSMCHEKQAKLLPADEVIYIGNTDVENLLLSEKENANPDSPLNKISFINENDILSFDSVHEEIANIMAPVLEGKELPRGITGWYYQQFLKMEYARKYNDEQYLVWDGDTIPCIPFSMYSTDGIPYLDVKKEYHKEYFDTIRTIFPRTEKVIEPSFISEHMLIIGQIMRDVMDTIELNLELDGDVYWKKILHAIPADKIQSCGFSEFETYGTYVAYRHPTVYKLREWHSFRLGAHFFDPTTICERDYEWLGRDFTAISFEKNQTIREDHRNIFDNPEYQAKLSAKKILEIAQADFQEGYIESWDILS